MAATDWEKIGEYLANIGAKGGSARTEKQRLARQRNAAKMREAKARKRRGGLEQKQQVKR